MRSTDSYTSVTCWSSRVLRSGTAISWAGVDVPDTVPGRPAQWSGGGAVRRQPARRDPAPGAPSAEGDGGPGSQRLCLGSPWRRGAYERPSPSPIVQGSPLGTLTSIAMSPCKGLRPRASLGEPRRRPVEGGGYGLADHGEVVQP